MAWQVPPANSPTTALTRSWCTQNFATSCRTHVVRALHGRTEVLDPLRQALHELEQLRCGGGGAIDSLALCLAADQPRLDAFELGQFRAHADVGCDLEQLQPLWHV